uniref:hypothetical protein n=1 Tax=Butyricimonas virosa TaxID=544645 RepID=UPI0022DEA334
NKGTNLKANHNRAALASFVGALVDDSTKLPSFTRESNYRIEDLGMDIRKLYTNPFVLLS